jgi:hypothetical protein
MIGTTTNLNTKRRALRREMTGRAIGRQDQELSPELVPIPIVIVAVRHSVTGTFRAMHLPEQVGRGRRMPSVFVVTIDVTKMLRPSARSTTITARHYPAAGGVVTIMIVVVVIVIVTIVPIVTPVAIPIAVSAAVALCAHVTMLVLYRRIVVHPDVTLTARLITSGRDVTSLDACTALFASLVAIHLGRGATSLGARTMLIARLIMHGRRRIVRRSIGARFI